ncbi:MAG: hypothetical protein ABSF08_14265, partial [Candidatus Cybelea sp.]
MPEILSIWRSPLDKVALSEARALQERQPVCTIVYDEDFSQITAYNYLAYGAQNFGGDSGTLNEDALYGMFYAMSNAPYGVGGQAFIEQYNFPITTPYHVTSAPYMAPNNAEIIGMGTGGQSGPTFFHFSISGTGTNLAFIECSGAHTSGGTIFRNLAFEWLGGVELTGSETCILANTWNVRAVKCNFVNCPIAFAAQGLNCGMEQCVVQYYNGPPGGSTLATELPLVILSGEQTFVIGPGDFQQTSILSEGPAGITAISIQNAEHFIISNIHL